MRLLCASCLLQVGYLVIFLIMQPNAFKCLLSRLTTGKRYVILSERQRSNNTAGPAASAELCDEDLDVDEITHQLNFELSSSDGINNSVNSSSNYVFSPSASTSLTSSKLSNSLRKDHDLFTSFIDTATATAAAAASQLRQTLSSEITEEKASIIQCSDSR